MKQTKLSVLTNPLHFSHEFNLCIKMECIHSNWQSIGNIYRSTRLSSIPCIKSIQYELVFYLKNKIYQSSSSHHFEEYVSGQLNLLLYEHALKKRLRQKLKMEIIKKWWIDSALSHVTSYEVCQDGWDKQSDKPNDDQYNIYSFR